MRTRSQDACNVSVDVRILSLQPHKTRKPAPTRDRVSNADLQLQKRSLLGLGHVLLGLRHFALHPPDGAVRNRRLALELHATK